MKLQHPILEILSYEKINVFHNSNFWIDSLNVKKSVKKIVQ